MAKVIDLKAHSPLVGTWFLDDDEPGVEYTIEAFGGTFKVSARDSYDGEQLIVSNVEWDGRVLRFRSLMPSTNHVATHAFVAGPDGEAEHTYTFCQTLRRKNVGATD